MLTDTIKNEESFEGVELAGFRQIYPQYNDWPAEKIVTAIKNKFPKYGEWEDKKVIHALDNKYSRNFSSLDEITPTLQPTLRATRQAGITGDVPRAPSAPAEGASQFLPDTITQGTTETRGLDQQYTMLGDETRVDPSYIRHQQEVLKPPEHLKSVAQLGDIEDEYIKNIEIFEKEYKVIEPILDRINKNVNELQKIETKYPEGEFGGTEKEYNHYMGLYNEYSKLTSKYGDRINELAVEEEGINSLNEAREKLLENIKGKGEIGFTEAIKRKEPLELYPFSPWASIKMADLYNAVRQVQAGKATSAQERVVRDFLLNEREIAIRGGHNLGAMVAEGVMQLPPFMLEFMATAGLSYFGKKAMAKATKKLVKHGIRKKLRKVAVMQGGKLVAGAVARSPAFVPKYGLQSYIRRRLPKEFDITPEGKINVTKSGDKPFTAFSKAYGELIIMLAAEEAGELFARGASKLGRKLIKKYPEAANRLKLISKALRNKWLKKNPNKTGKDFTSELIKEGGYHGFLEELGEEQLDRTLRGIFGIEDAGGEAPDKNILNRMVGSLPEGEELLAEAIVLSVPMLARKAGITVEHGLEKRAGRKELKKAKGIYDEIIGAEVDIQPEKPSVSPQPKREFVSPTEEVPIGPEPVETVTADLEQRLGPRKVKSIRRVSGALSKAVQDRVQAKAGLSTKDVSAIRGSEVGKQAVLKTLEEQEKAGLGKIVRIKKTLPEAKKTFDEINVAAQRTLRKLEAARKRAVTPQEKKAFTQEIKRVKDKLAPPVQKVKKIIRIKEKPKTPKTLKPIAEKHKLGYIGIQEGFGDIPDQHMFNVPEAKGTTVVVPIDATPKQLETKVAKVKNKFKKIKIEKTEAKAGVVRIDEYGKKIVREYGDFDIAVNSVENPTFLTMWDGKKKIGELSISEKDIGEKNYVKVGKVWTDPKYRKQGVATELYRTLLEKLPEDKKGIIGYYPDIVSKKAISQIYKKLGGKIDKKTGNFIVEKKPEGIKLQPKIAKKGVLGKQVKTKQSWEMTREEFVKEKSLKHIPSDATDYLSDQRQGEFKFNHKVLVRGAIDEGKSVPPEVLKDYPELQKKPIEKAQIARAEKSLDKPIKYEGKNYKSKKEWLNSLKDKGYTATEKEVAKPIKNIAQVKEKLERLKKTAPTENPNHPETIRLRELEQSIKVGRKEVEFRLVSPDETFVTVGKAEYDYFKLQGEKPKKIKVAKPKIETPKIVKVKPSAKQPIDFTDKNQAIRTGTFVRDITKGKLAGGMVVNYQGRELKLKPEQIKGPKYRTFHSKLVRIVENKLDQIPQKAQSVENYLIKQGVKKEELDWIGVNDWIKENQKEGKIDRNALAEFVRQNQVEVKEVEKGGKDGLMARIDEARNYLYDNNFYANEELDRMAGGEVLAAYQKEVDIGNIPEGLSPTKFSQYTLPGGENYKEFLLTLPVSSSEFEAEKLDGGRYRVRTKGSNVPNIPNSVVAANNASEAIDIIKNRQKIVGYTSHVFDEPNIVVWTRFNDRKVGDEKVLFIEEIQSDWHQKGKDVGYEEKVIFDTPSQWEARSDGRGGWTIFRSDGSTVAAWTKATNLHNKKEALDFTFRNRQSMNFPEKRTEGVPDAPFKKTWHEVALKRMLKYAEENGYDRVAWTSGEMQADRYDLAKQIDALRYEKKPDGTYNIYADKGEDIGIITKYNLKPNQIEEYVGKEAARKIIERAKVGEEQKLVGLDLKVGGEGMKRFYDEKIPSFLRKFGKKFGAQVESINIETERKGMKFISERDNDGTYNIINVDTQKIIESGFESLTDADSVIDKKYRTGGTEVAKVLSLPITNQMREAMHGGLPLFRFSSALTKAPISLQKEAEALVSELTGGQVSVKFVDKIMENPKAVAAYQNNAMRIVEGKGNPKEHVLHETVHWAEETMAEVDPKGYEALLKEQPDEELRAEKIIDYANTHKGFTGKVKAFIDRILRFLKKLFGSDNYNKLTNLYDKILSGKFAKPRKIKISRPAKFRKPTVIKVRPAEVPVKELSGFERLKDVWFGRKDTRIVQIENEKRRIQSEIKKATGAKKYTAEEKDLDRAIQIYIDTKRNPDHIRKYWRKLSDEQKKIIKLSQNLPSKIKKIANEISKSYHQIGKEARMFDVIKNVLDNYVARVWDLGKKGSEKSRKFGIKTGHSKRRKFATIIEGWANGFNLKVEGASSNLAILKEEVVKTIEDKKFIKSMMKLKTVDGKRLLTTKNLEGYKEVIHPNFNVWKWTGKVEAGKTYGKNYFVDKNGDVFEKQRLYAPNNIADNMNNILGISKLSEIEWIRVATKYNAILKSWILQSSLFHHLAFTRSYWFGTRKKTWKEWNIRQAYREGVKAIEQENDVVMHGVKNGLTLRLKQDWNEDLLHEKTAIGAMIDKMGGEKVKQKILDLRQKHADFLFGELGAGLKAKAFTIEYRNHTKKHPDMNPDEAAKHVANLINDDFGGLHLGRLGRNPTIQHIYRLFALASDWTESNVRTMVKAFKKGNEGQLYRNFWASVLTKGVGLTVLANLTTAGFDEDDEEARGHWERFVRNYKRAWKEGKLRYLDVDITPLYKALGGKTVRRKYFPILGHFKDPIKFILHPFRSAHHKGSVIYKMFYEALSGTDWAHRRFTTISEILGIDKGKGYYKTTRKGYYKKGDPKWGKLKGQTVTWRTGKKGPLSYERIPSYLISQFKGIQPVQIQNLIAWIMGEMEAFDAIGKSAGLRIATTYEEEKVKKDKRPSAGIPIKSIKRGTAKTVKVKRAKVKTIKRK